MVYGQISDFELAGNYSQLHHRELAGHVLYRQSGDKEL